VSCREREYVSGRVGFDDLKKIAAVVKELAAKMRADAFGRNV
jgi:hypothetical protein